MSSLVTYAKRVFAHADLTTKIHASLEACRLWQQEQLPVRDDNEPIELPERPCMPDRPMLVKPQLVPSMKTSNVSPSAYILLNIAHIEITAVHTYWDTIIRFAHQIQSQRLFIDDFLSIISDECKHFQMCQQRLAALGHSYGDLPAHSCLWDYVMVTSNDLLARLAVVPMAQEARGLDAGPRFVRILENEHDQISAEIVSQIVKDEVNHVSIGTKWFKTICHENGADPVAEFHSLIRRYMAHGIGRQFNTRDRKLAGLTPEYYEPLVANNRA